MNYLHPLTWTIRTHLLVIVMALTACMVGWTFYVNSMVEQLTLARASDTVHEYSSKIAERYLAISRETQQVLSALSSSEEVRAGDFQAITALLKKSHAAMPHYSTMVAVSADGFVRACSIPAVLPIDVRQRQWFKRTIASKVFIADEFIISKSAGTASLPYALPVLDQEGKVRMILGAALKLSFFQELFADKTTTPRSEIYLLDHDDTVLFSSAKPQMIGLASKECLPPNLSLRGPGLQEIAVEGGDKADRIYVIVPITIGDRESRFTLVVNLNKRELHADSKRQMMVNLLLICGCATAFAILLFTYGRRVISDPLRRLLAATREVSSGNLSTRTGLSYQSQEFGVLAQAIDGMVAALEIDANNRQEQEKALRESEARFKALVNNAADAIYLADARGRLLDVNAEAERQTGYSREELLSMSIVNIDAHHDKPMLVSFLERLASVGKATITTSHLRKDGTILPVEVRTVYLPSETVPMVLGVARDITERKQAEARLQESLQRYERVLDGANGGIWDWDIPNNKVHFSSRWKEIRGYTDEEISDSESEWSDSIHPDDKQAVMAAVAAHFARESNFFQMDYRVRCKDGSWKWIQDRGKASRDSTGKVIRMAGSEIDITDRKRIEEEQRKLQSQLLQAQKMEAIGTLAGGIAHDFNNILGAILGYAEMAMDDCPPNSKARYDIIQVVKAGKRARELVKQILAFSRQTEHDLIPLQPAIIITEALKLLRSSLPTTITIIQQIDPDAGVVLADPTQLHQIVMNLCTNAFHAMEKDGGTLEVSLGKKELIEKDLLNEPHLQPGSYVQLSIRDSGVGIAPENLERIFDPYFTTKEAGKGTGMGLAITHGIVQSYGGSIRCESRPGEGTVFHIILPLADSSTSLVNEEVEVIRGGNEHILLIDDEELLVDMGKRMLERLGYRVTTQTDSIKALATFQNQPLEFDLVITDQTMPGMIGSHLAERMLQVRPDLPIILCTGYSTLVSDEKAHLIGIKGFAMKPLTKKDIAILIRKALDNR